MRKIYKQILSRRTAVVSLCVSVTINILLLVTVYVAEHHSHVFKQALIRRGIIIGNEDDKDSPDFWARAGWTNTIKKLHINFDIAFFGNSITCGSDFQLAFPDKKIINLGYSGNTILGMIKRVPMLQKSGAKKIFVMAGTNDLVHVSLDEYKKRYINLISTIQDSIPDAKIYIESVLPTNHEMANYASNDKVKEANRIVAKLAKQYNCEFIDLYPLYANEEDELPREITRDGVHLLSQHYDRWADKIEPYVYQ